MPPDARGRLIVNHLKMQLLQCGFLANKPAVAGQEPNNSHEIAAATPVPVSSTLTPAAGGWGVAIGLTGDGKAYAWCAAAAVPPLPRRLLVAQPPLHECSGT